MTNYKKIKDLKKNYLKRLQQPKENWPVNVQEAMNCIQDNLFNDNLTIGWLMEECKINGSSFSNKFRFITGSYPKEYILGHRIKLSKKILVNTNASVTTVSFSVGFNSLSSFCKTFKRKVGVRPSLWRDKANQ